MAMIQSRGYGHREIPRPIEPSASPMYRPFKDFINAQFLAWASTHAPGYAAVKSLARGGGVALRRRLPSGRSYFLMLQHIADRDRSSVLGGWSNRAWFEDWDTAEMGYYWKLDAEARRTFVATLQSAPATLVTDSNEGTFIASHLDPDIVVHELDVGDGGVPYEDIAAIMAADPGTVPKVELFLGEPLTRSMLEGHVPPLVPANPAHGLKEPHPVTSKLLSWECWFEHVIARRPGETELSAVCGPAVQELTRQAALLVEVTRAMNGEQGSR